MVDSTKDQALRYSTHPVLKGQPSTMFGCVPVLSDQSSIEHRVFMSQDEYVKVNAKQIRATQRALRRRDVRQMGMNFRILLAPLLQK